MIKEINNPFRKNFNKNLLIVFITSIFSIIIFYIFEYIFSDQETNVNIEKFSLIYVLSQIVSIIFILKKYKIDIRAFFTKPFIDPTIKTLKEIITPIYFFLLLSVILFFVSFSYKTLNNNEKFELIQQNHFSLVTITDTNSIIHNIVILLLTCFIGPIVEEIFFRGFLLSRLAIKTNLKDAMISSSIIFGLLHGISFIWISILGYILSNIYIRNKSLIYPILAHSLYNFVVILFTSFFTSNDLINLFLDYYLLFTIFSLFISIYSLSSLDKFFKDSSKKIKELKELPYFENYKKCYGEDIIFINDDLEEKKKNKFFNLKYLIISILVLNFCFIGTIFSLDYYYVIRNFTISEKRINDYTRYNQKNPSSSILFNNIFITWQSENQDGDNWGIYAKSFGLNGKNLGKEITINETKKGKQENPNVKALDKRFIVTWNGNGKDDEEGIYARYFDDKGKPVSHEFRVNDITSGIQSKPIILANKDSCDCNFYILWKNEEKNSISIKEYDMENYNELSEEIEIDIPKDINLKTLKFDISNQGKIFSVGKENDKVILNFLNTYKKSFSPPVTVTQKGYMPNISISKEEKIIVTWQSIDEKNDVYELRYKEFNTKLKEKISSEKIIKTSNFLKFKNPNSYLLGENLVTIFESDDVGLQYGVIFLFFYGMYSYISNNQDYGIQVISNQKLLGDSTQLNDYSFKNQSNVSSDYLLIEEDNTFIFINSWQSENQDGDKLGIYAQVFSIEDNSLLPLWE